MIAPAAFDLYAGVQAVNHTISIQNQSMSSTLNEDPYAAFAGTCDRGDVQPVLPRLHIRVSTDVQDPHVVRSVPQFQIEYPILSLPDKKQDSALYNLWPSLKRHLGSSFPLTGPYCYGNDAKRAYAVRLSYDSHDTGPTSDTWQVVKGCVEGLPCWDGGDGSNGGPVIPYNNGASGMHTVDPTGWVALVCYLLGFTLIISVVFNVQLSAQLRRTQEDHPSSSSAAAQVQRRRRPVAASNSRRLYSQEGDLEEPLLSAASNNEEEGRTLPVQFSSSAFDALGPTEDTAVNDDGGEGGGEGGAEETKEEAE